MFNQILMFAIDELIVSPSREFYDKLFANLDLSNIQPTKFAHTGRKPTDFHALIRAFIVMKCERFSQISDLWDYLNNNRIIAYSCGFGFNVPSYSVLQRFIKNCDHVILEKLMQNQVLKCDELGLISTKNIAEDSTQIYANTCHNNAKTFMSNKFSNDNPPSSDPDCHLGFHANSNALGETKGEYYWGYKEHVLLDATSGLPICTTTTGANVHDSKVTLDMLTKTHAFLSIAGCNFIGDMAFDSEEIYAEIKRTYQGKCFIPLNSRGKKSVNINENGRPVCECGLVMVKNGKRFKNNCHFQRYTCTCNSNRTAECPANKGKRCDCYLPLETTLRLSINRETLAFKRTYAKRTEVERYNSRFKSLGTERAWVRNGKSVKNMNLIAHISLLTVAITAAKTDKNLSLLGLKSLKRAC